MSRKVNFLFDLLSFLHTQNKKKNSKFYIFAKKTKKSQKSKKRMKIMETNKKKNVKIMHGGVEATLRTMSLNIEFSIGKGELKIIKLINFKKLPKLEILHLITNNFKI